MDEISAISVNFSVACVLNGEARDALHPVEIALALG